MKIYIYVIVITLISFSFSSCATLFTGQNQNLSFSSEPNGANVTLDGVHLGKTPFEAKIKKSSKKVFMFSKEGYQNEMVILKGKFNPTSLLSILFAGVGIGVDFVTGAAWKYESDSVYLDLEIKGDSENDKKEIGDKEKILINQLNKKKKEEDDIPLMIK